MLNEINQELQKLEEQVLVKERVMESIKELKQALRDTKNERDRLYVLLKSEQRDVDKLSRVSLSSLYYGFTGQKESKLKQEEREVLNAKMKMEHVEAKIHVIEDELDVAEQRLDDILLVENRYNELVIKKKDLMREMPFYDEKITRLEEEQHEARVLFRELDEASRAGHQALDRLREAEGILRSAKNWGIYDMLSKDSWISSMVKQNKLRDAQAKMSSANHALRSFEREMKDVQKTFPSELTFSTLVRTFDIWFDNIFTDIHVQGKINRARDDMNHAINSIRKALGHLRKEKETQHRLVKELEDDVQKIIMSAT